MLLVSISFVSFFAVDLCSDGCDFPHLSESDCASPSVDAGLALFDQLQCCADCSGEGNPSGMPFAASIPLVGHPSSARVRRSDHIPSSQPVCPTWPLTACVPISTVRSIIFVVVRIRPCWMLRRRRGSLFPVPAAQGSAPPVLLSSRKAMLRNPMPWA